MPMRLQSGKHLFFGPFIDRAIVEANEGKAGYGQRREDAGHQAIRRFSTRPVGVDCAANGTQAERCVVGTTCHFLGFELFESKHRLRSLARDEIPHLKEAWPTLWNIHRRRLVLRAE